MVCMDCCEERELSPEDEKLMGIHAEDFPEHFMVKKACGCPACNHTGYRGRIAVHEILTIDKEVRRMITDGVQVEEIKEYAVKKQGMRTLKQSALYYLRSGVTTVEEVTKVAYYEE